MDTMLSALARNRWVSGPRGMLAMLVGIAAGVWPGFTLVVLVAPFAAYAAEHSAGRLVPVFGEGLVGVEPIGAQPPTGVLADRR
jgi:hypothetical protein